jgi:hypothetical protein
MVQSKSILGLLILIIVLVSGCVNPNEPSQKTQSTDEPKVINLDAQQLILNDSEVEEVLGSDWKNTDTSMISIRSYNDTGDGIEAVYDKEPFNELIWYDSAPGTGQGEYAKPITIQTLVFTNSAMIKDYYSKQITIYSQNSQYYLFKQNKIDIGDTGDISTIEDLMTIKDPSNVNIIIKIIFIRNNVMSIIYFDTEKSNVLNIETAIELAKKQDAKISRILELIK